VNKRDFIARLAYHQIHSTTAPSLPIFGGGVKTDSLDALATREIEQPLRALRSFYTSFRIHLRKSHHKYLQPFHFPTPFQDAL